MKDVKRVTAAVARADIKAEDGGGHPERHRRQHAEVKFDGAPSSDQVAERRAVDRPSRLRQTETDRQRNARPKPRTTKLVVWRTDTPLPVPKRRPHTHPSRRKPMPQTNHGMCQIR